MVHRRILAKVSGAAVAACLLVSSLAPSSYAAGGNAFKCAGPDTNQYHVGQGNQTYFGPAGGSTVSFSHYAYSVARQGSCLGTPVVWNRFVVQNSVYRNSNPFIFFFGVGCDNTVDCLDIRNWSTGQPGLYSNITANNARKTSTSVNLPFGILVPGTNCTGNPTPCV
jgi:hypothetical protein